MLKTPQDPDSDEDLQDEILIRLVLGIFVANTPEAIKRDFETRIRMEFADCGLTKRMARPYTINDRFCWCIVHPSVDGYVRKLERSG